MKFLKELHNLFEGEVDGVNAVDIADLVKYFPQTKEKAISKLWGGPRLTWKGVPFFGDKSLTDDEIPQAVTEWADGGEEVEFQLDEIEFELGDEQYVIDPSFKQKINPIDDGQEVYIGYDEREDCLYVGYDVWASEEAFNQEWDEQFEKETGDAFDYDNHEHQHVFNQAHKEFTSSGQWLLFKIEESGGHFTAELDHFGKGTFYHGKDGMSGDSYVKRKNLIDLRLD